MGSFILWYPRYRQNSPIQTGKKKY